MHATPPPSQTMQQSWISFLEKLAIVFFLVIVAAVGDFCWYAVMEPKGLFRLVPGESLAVNGDVDRASFEQLYPVDLPASSSRPEAGPAQLDKAVQGPDKASVEVRLLELRGPMWRGEARVLDKAAPGDYLIQVFAKELAPPADVSLAVRLRVFDSDKARRAASPSFCESRLDLSPGWVGLIGAAGAAFALATLFVLKGREEKLLQAKGLGHIYSWSEEKKGVALIFGLGANQGVAIGDRLALLDRDLRQVCELTVTKVENGTGHAMLPAKTPIDAMGFVRRL